MNYWKLQILWTYTIEHVNHFYCYNISINIWFLSLQKVWSFNSMFIVHNLYEWWCNICPAYTVKYSIVDPCSENTCEHICVLTHVRENNGLGYKCICAIGYELSDNGMNCTSKNKMCSKTNILTQNRQTFQCKKCLSWFKFYKSNGDFFFMVDMLHNV